jgi:hypothetical protein
MRSIDSEMEQIGVAGRTAELPKKKRNEWIIAQLLLLGILEEFERQ